MMTIAYQTFEFLDNLVEISSERAPAAKIATRHRRESSITSVGSLSPPPTPDHQERKRSEPLAPNRDQDAELESLVAHWDEHDAQQ